MGKGSFNNYVDKFLALDYLLRLMYSQVSNKRANGIKEQGEKLPCEQDGIKEQGGKFSLISDERT